MTEGKCCGSGRQREGKSQLNKSNKEHRGRNLTPKLRPILFSTSSNGTRAEAHGPEVTLNLNNSENKVRPIIHQLKETGQEPLQNPLGEEELINSFFIFKDIICNNFWT